MATSAAALLALAAVILLVPVGRPGVRGLTGMVAQRPRPREHAGRRPPERLVAPAGALCAGAAAWLVIGGVAGGVTGVVVGVLTVRLLRRLEPRGRRAERELAEAELPLALDLVAACLRAGQDATHAAESVGAALGGELGARLVRVGKAGALGTPPAQAWEALTRLLDSSAVARRVARASASGTELASTLDQLAADLRSARRSGRDAAVRRAGVLVVLPLGLCFLPAFVCLGVIPVAAGLLSGVLR